MICDFAHILLCVEYLGINNAFQIGKGDVRGGIVLLYIGYDPATALLRDLPVERAGARRAVATKRHKADLHIVIQHFPTSLALKAEHALTIMRNALVNLCIVDLSRLQIVLNRLGIGNARPTAVARTLDGRYGR